MVLNRPTPVGVGDILEGWAALTGEPGVVFQGGPVSLDSALGVAVIPGDSSGDRVPLGWRRVHGAIGLVDLEAPPELLASALGSLRIFAGYAGWGPGQLEDELAEGAWYVVESEPGDVSSPPWRDCGGSAAPPAQRAGDGGHLPGRPVAQLMPGRFSTLGGMSTLEPERGTGTGTLVEPTPQVSHGDGDHERFAHYVQKDKIMASALDGTPVVALCGKVWVPGRDPKKYPVCPMCKEIYESMGAGGNDGQGGDGSGKS